MKCVRDASEADGGPATRMHHQEEAEPASGIGRYDEPRSILGDGHARRCVRLRRASALLELPCCRAANASVGVRLSRRGVPREIVRDILALAFSLPGEAERRATRTSDDAFLAAAESLEVMRARHDLENKAWGENRDESFGPAWRHGREVYDFHACESATKPRPDPPLRPDALETAVREALAGPPGLTDVGRTLTLLAASPEAYEVNWQNGMGQQDGLFSPLFPWEAKFPGLIGCATLTVKSSVIKEEGVWMGGATRRMRKVAKKGYYTEVMGEFALAPTERSFTAPSGSVFSVSELALAVTSIPESWRQIGRYYGLVYGQSRQLYEIGYEEPVLTCGRWEKLEFSDRPDDDRPPKFASCTLVADLDNAKFQLADGGHGVLEVQWKVSYEDDWHDHTELSFDKYTDRDGDFCRPSDILEMWDYYEDLTCRYDRHDPDFESDEDPPLSPLMKLRKKCIDRARWAPEYKRKPNGHLITPYSKPMSDISSFASNSDSD